MRSFYKSIILTLSILAVYLNSFSQSKDYSEKERADVMILGTFHFAYPNLDRIKIEEKDQLDFSSTERQEEMYRGSLRLHGFFTQCLMRADFLE